jgi:hypothetical protein
MHLTFTTQIYLTLAALYVLPFVMIVLMPGWRSFAVTSAAFGVLLVWAFVDTMADDDFGVGAVLAFGWILAGGLGTISGSVTRAVTLVRRRWKWRGATFLVNLAGFILGPTMIFGLILLQEWQQG